MISRYNRFSFQRKQSTIASCYNSCLKYSCYKWSSVNILHLQFMLMYLSLKLHLSRSRKHETRPCRKSMDLRTALDAIKDKWSHLVKTSLSVTTWPKREKEELWKEKFKIFFHQNEMPLNILKSLNIHYSSRVFGTESDKNLIEPRPLFRQWHNFRHIVEQLSCLTSKEQKKPHNQYLKWQNKKSSGTSQHWSAPEDTAWQKNWKERKKIPGRPRKMMLQWQMEERNRQEHK